MAKSTTVGVDIAEQTLQVSGADEPGIGIAHDVEVERSGVFIH